MLRGGTHSITSVECAHILNGDFEPVRNETECPPSWLAKDKLTLAVVLQRMGAAVKEQTTLIEAFSVAVSFHVLLFPVIWFVGWALPWPKPPSITTVIELNLENWPIDARPTKIEELYDVEMSKAHAKH
jgi:hypothetical protein